MPSNTTVPVDQVWVPSNASDAPSPLTRTAPVILRPLRIRTTELVWFSSRSPVIATPLSRLLEFAVMASVWPSANATVPPTTVPPSRFHVPVVALNVNVLPVLVSVPVRFTVPPIRVKLVEAPRWRTVPPRFNVPPLTLTAPEPDAATAFRSSASPPSSGLQRAVVGQRHATGDVQALARHVRRDRAVVDQREAIAEESAAADVAEPAVDRETRTERQRRTAARPLRSTDGDPSCLRTPRCPSTTSGCPRRPTTHRHR